MTDDEYRVVGFYCGVDNKVTHKHVTCGKVYEARPKDFLRGGRCPHCCGNRRKTTFSFKEEVFKIVRDEYTVLGLYMNNLTPIIMRHSKCGLEYEVRPTDFLSKGSRCPYCAESKGERNIRDYLVKKNIKFASQFRLENCRDKLPLPFDFAVKHKERWVLIEYDGEHHSRPVDFAGKGEEWALENFRKTQRNDRIKTDYCRANGIPLIRIDYTEFDDIEAILTRELTKLGVISSETGNRLTDVTASEKASA
ncbi:hypothetical protein [Paenibacillus sp. SN-8-1]|uniref:hypothetical protein n=1 Tax=Paenibacillus sp. SN-8-1 TaxID=3435409 RepID=UPI003D9A77F5